MISALVLALVLPVASGLAPVSASASEAQPRRLELTDHEHLPFAFAIETARRLEVAGHDRPDLAMAYYQPAAPPPLDPAGPLGDDEGRGAQAPAPRIVLHRASYPLEGPIPLGSLAIDQVEYLAFSLLVAHLHRQVGDGTPYGDELRRGAGAADAESGNAGAPSYAFGESTVGPTAPRNPTFSASSPEAAARLGEQILAIASFGSHLLSLANEIERSARRRRASGRDFCSLIERRIGLFLIWERAFENEFVTSPPGARSGTVAVEKAAQRALVANVLEDRWQGDAVADFGAIYCRNDD